MKFDRLVITDHAHFQWKVRVDPDGTDADIEAAFRASKKARDSDPLPLRQHFWRKPDTVLSVWEDVMFVSVAKGPKAFVLVTVVSDRLKLRPPHDAAPAEA